MNDVLKIARRKIALQRAFLGRAILLFTKNIKIPRKSSSIQMWSQASPSRYRRWPSLIIQGSNYCGQAYSAWSSSAEWDLNRFLVCGNCKTLFAGLTQTQAGTICGASLQQILTRIISSKRMLRFL